MQRMLALSAIAILMLSAVVPAPAQATAPSYPLHFGNGNLPDGCTATITDNCYHIKHDINPLHSAQIDVLIVPPVSPMPERDTRIMRQAIEMWDAGLDFLARDMGLDWLADGVGFNILVDDGTITTDPLWDPEIVVIASNPVGGAGIGIMPVSYKFCKGENPFASLPWDQVPGVDNHHGNSGTYVDECNGDSTCFAINGAIDPEYSLINLFNLFDLVAHEVGHCLTLGHVGNGLDGTATTVPCYDIMAYQSGCNWPSYPLRCVSTLNVESFAIGISGVLKTGGIGPGPVVSNGGTWHAQHPSQHYYATSEGSAWKAHVGENLHNSAQNAPDCIQPDLGPVPGEPVNFYPTLSNEDEEVPEVTILSPQANAEVSGTITVSGTVAFVVSGSGLTAVAGGPYNAAIDQAVPIMGSASGGASDEGYTCVWSGTGAAFANAAACSTSVTFSALGDHTITLTVDDGEDTDSGDATVHVSAAALPVPDGAYAGSIFAYNQEPACIGVSNILALATGSAGDEVPKYPAGTNACVSVRSIGTGTCLIIGNEAGFAMFDAGANRVHLEEGLSVGQDNDPTGADTGCDISASAVEMPLTAGRYYMAAYIVDGSGLHWVDDTSASDPTNLKPIEVIGTPAVPGSTSTVEFTHEGEFGDNTFFVEESDPAQIGGFDPTGLGVAAPDTSHWFTLDIDAPSDVTFTLDWTDTLSGQTDLDLYVTGTDVDSGTEGGGSTPIDGVGEVVTLEDVPAGTLDIQVFPYLILGDPEAGVTYTLSAEITVLGPADADADGVADGDDDCPGTPNGTPVDETGCPLDEQPTEHVTVSIGGITASVPVDSSGGSAAWTINDLDLNSLASDAYALTATWVDGDGTTVLDTHTIMVTVQGGQQTGPRVNIITPQDGATLNDPQGGLTVTGAFDPNAPLEQGTSMPSLPISWQDPGNGGNGDYVFIDSPTAATVVTGSTTLEGRAGNSPTDPDCVTDCDGGDGETYDFGEPQANDLRPGDWSDVCTLNFLFEHQGRYFFGSAAHCAATGSNTDTNGCETTPQQLGSTQNLGGKGIAAVTATLAYSSWGTMQRVNEASTDACYGNDFALFEIKPSDLNRIHPAVRMYGGPTGLGQIGDMAEGDELRGYGRSNLHDDTLVLPAEQSLLNPKIGYYLGESNGGWSYWVYLLPQGIPGDSGGGLMDIEGNALGAASTISAAGASNNYANIAKMLDYMRAKEGWAPTLVTWDDFDPEPRPDAYGVPASTPDALPTVEEILAQEPAFVSGGFVPPLAQPEKQGLLARLWDVFTGWLQFDVTTSDAEDPSGDGLLPGSDIGKVTVTQDDGTSFKVNLQLNEEATPSAQVVLRAQYGVDFVHERTGGSHVELQLRAKNDPSAGGWSYWLAAPSSDGAWVCVVSGVTIDGSFESGTITWTVDYADLTVTVNPAPATSGCQAFTFGASAKTGDVLSEITGLSTHVIGIVDFAGTFGDSSGTPGTYTLGASVETPQVTFTVNGQAAGSADIVAGAWDHAIDFSAFTADVDGKYTVEAASGTATATIVYASDDVIEDPCSDVSSKIVVTLGSHTSCATYDPAVAGDWNAGFDDLSDLAEGSHVLSAKAYSALGAELASDSVLVNMGSNQAPIVTVPGPQTVEQGQALSFTVTATDADGDGVTITADDLPAGAAFDGSAFSWTPAVGDVGSHVVTFQATDGRGGQDSEAVSITVTDAGGSNTAPVLTDIGDKSVAEGDQLSFAVSATDADGDTLVYSATGLPEGAGFANRQFTWRPSTTQAGSYAVTFTADDQRGGTDSESVTITVTQVGGNGDGDGELQSDPVAPEIRDLVSDLTTYLAGDTVHVGGLLFDGNGADGLVVTAQWGLAGGEPTDVDPEAIVIERHTQNNGKANVGLSFELPMGTPTGNYQLSLTVTDSDDLGDSEVVTFAIALARDPLRLGYTVGDSLDFGAVAPGEQDVDSENQFTVTNQHEQGFEVLFDLTDFVRSDGPEKITAVNNILLFVDEDGDDVVDATVPLDANSVVLGTVAPGETMKVTVRIVQVPQVLPVASYGATFSVVEDL